MKTLIFSDSHLTMRFEEKKFNYLHRIISSVDRVIINGDFWEGFWITFDQFFNSEWSKLFPLLKQKNTIYIFGNHDNKNLNNIEKIQCFSDIQTAMYSFTENGETFIIEHGDRLFPTETDCINIHSPIFRTKIQLINFTEKLLSKMCGSMYQNLLHQYNKKIKQNIKNQNTNVTRIFGHTHCPEVDAKHHFINTGIIKHGLAQYALIENGNITIVKERYN